MLFYLLACATEHAIIDTDNDNSPVIELSCPQAEISLSCPEVVIPDIVCPEPVVRDIVIETSCPDVYIDQPDVNVTVEGPDMTGIEAAIDDMTNNFQNLISSISQGSNVMDYHAQSGSCNSANSASGTVLFTNNTSQTFVITSVITFEDQNLIIGGSSYVSHFADISGHSLNSVRDSGVPSGNMTYPLYPGETISCGYDNGVYYFQGFYQN